MGLMGLAPTPVRGAPAERAASGASAADIDAREIGRLAVSDLDQIPTDVHGSADYRRRVGAAMVARAWEDAMDEALKGNRPERRAR